jgi:hypothetical protein
MGGHQLNKSVYSPAFDKHYDRVTGEDLPPTKPKSRFVVDKGVPLDSSMIDCRTEYHSSFSTHFTMYMYGVYPEGTTQAQVRSVVEGTFGGYFASFGNGEFQYIAYTD